MVSSHHGTVRPGPQWPGYKSGHRAGSVESQQSGSSSDLISDGESWGETDKDTEEHLASLTSNSDMDMSLSSNDSPTPPGLITSTPLANERPVFRHLSGQSQARVTAIMPRPPPMSFLFPSPDYASFPASLVPSRPYSAMSGASQLSSKVSVKSSLPPPSLPPKPASLASLVGGSDTAVIRGFPSQSKSAGSFHDYENYFFI